MSAHSDILGGLSLEQLEEGISLLEHQITKADEEGRTDDAVTYILTRNAIRHEIDGRTEGIKTYVMTVTAHHAIQILSVHYPEKTVEELQRDNEYDVRMMWNERAKRSYSVNEERAHWMPDMPVDMYMHSSRWPAMRPLAPLAIIHKEGEPALFTNAAPPLNAWWTAEDRVAELGAWELVWREWRGEEIHEAWVQRLEEGCMHYLTRYKGGEASPLPLQAI